MKSLSLFPCCWSRYLWTLVVDSRHVAQVITAERSEPREPWSWGPGAEECQLDVDTGGWWLPTAPPEQLSGASCCYFSFSVLS